MNARVAVDLRRDAQVLPSGQAMTSDPDAKPKARTFKSAEKPVSLHPLSLKQALEALLQVGPFGPDRAAKRPQTDPTADDG